MSATEIEVIEKFTGEGFKSDGSSVGAHRDWYPGPGVRIAYRAVAIDEKGAAYAKVTIDDSDVDMRFLTKKKLEAAVYRVEGEALVARNVEVEPGTLLTEIVTMRRDGGMEHRLEFNGVMEGTWLCDD